MPAYMTVLAVTCAGCTLVATHEVRNTYNEPVGKFCIVHASKMVDILNGDAEDAPDGLRTQVSTTDLCTPCAGGTHVHEPAQCPNGTCPCAKGVFADQECPHFPDDPASGSRCTICHPAPRTSSSPVASRTRRGLAAGVVAAQYQSICPECGSYIEYEDPIVQNDSDQWVHEECA